MFIVFGWPERKSGQQLLSAYCSACRRDTAHKAFTRQQWFTLFFIPIFPVGTKHPHAICNVCGQDAQAPTPARAAPPPLPAGVSPLLAGPTASRSTKRCPACAEDILLDAVVCRFCGHNFSAGEIAQAAQDQQARTQAAAAAAQQVELVIQQQRRVKQLRGRFVRRLGCGAVLASMGAFMLILMIAMFFTRPSPGQTVESQRNAAVISGCFLGLAPLLIGVALLLGAKSANRLLVAEQQAPPARTP
ncbi:MAG: zinc-ribbon domain-containing protein [Bryobacteraceae bacterium]|jgi:hypothetical protein